VRKWLKGASTTAADFGNPVDERPTTRFCVYDQSGLRLDAHVPPRGCVSRQGLLEGDRHDGLQVQGPGPHAGRHLAARPQGRHWRGRRRSSCRARVALLGMPSDLSTLTPGPVTVQISASTGVCWEAIYSTPPTAQSATQFKDGRTDASDGHDRANGWHGVKLR